MSGEGKKRVRRLVLGVFILLIILGLVFMYAYAEYDEYVNASKNLQFNLSVLYYPHPLMYGDVFVFDIELVIYNPSSKDLTISDLSLSIYMEDYQITTLQRSQVYVRMREFTVLTEKLELKTSQIARFFIDRPLTFRAVGTAHLRIRVLSIPVTISIPIDIKYVSPVIVTLH
jgi:hypothetical protein